MASTFGGMQPLQCPSAFTMALTGGAMEQEPSYTFDGFRLEPPRGAYGGVTRGWPCGRGRWRGVCILPLVTVHTMYTRSPQEGQASGHGSLAALQGRSLDTRHPSSHID